MPPTGHDDHDDHDPDQLVEVFATGSAPEAEVVKGLLESNDIPAVLRGLSQSPYRVGGSYVWVPVELEERARSLIQEAQQDAAEGSDPVAVEAEEPSD